MTQAARDQEYDDDRLAGGSFNSIFGNNRFNTIRAGWTYEKNGFTDERLQEGIPNTELPPSLAMATFFDGPATGAQFRINNSYEISDAFSQFIPSWLGGDHDLKVGGQYIYSTIHLPDQGDMNGRFIFSTDRAFNQNDPRSYPERLQIRVPSASNILMPNNVFVLFAQDKFHRGNLTLNLGVRYDVELLPITNAFNPFFSQRRTCRRQEQHRAEAGLHLEAVRHRDLDRPRRLRHLLRQDHDDYDLPFASTGVYSDSFTVTFPTSSADPGPSSGRLPTDPMLVNGPVVNRAAINALYPPGSVGRNTGQVFLDNPDRRVPQVQQLSLGYERQVGQHMAVTADYIKSWNRDQLINYDLNPGLRVDTSRTGPHQLHRPREHRRPARHLAVRQPGAHPCQRRLVGIRRGQLLAREAVQQPLGGPGVLRGRLRARQRRGQPARLQQLSGGRRSSVRSQLRAARRRPAATTSSSTVASRFRKPAG